MRLSTVGLDKTHTDHWPINNNGNSSWYARKLINVEPKPTNQCCYSTLISISESLSWSGRRTSSECPFKLGSHWLWPFIRNMEMDDVSLIKTFLKSPSTRSWQPSDMKKSWIIFGFPWEILRLLVDQHPLQPYAKRSKWWFHAEYLVTSPQMMVQCIKRYLQH